jgi:guanine deaminase
MQVVTGKLWWGTTMIEYLDRIGFLKPQTQFIHAIWLNPREIDVLAGAGVTVQHNPASALRSGSGLAPVRALLEAGVNVSLGTDGCGSIESTDMQNVLYLAPLLQRLRDDKRNWILAKDALRAATLGGARAFGRGNELGAITKGRIADLVAFRIDGIAFTPLNNPINQLVYSGRKQVDLVMVDGDVILAKGRLTHRRGSSVRRNPRRARTARAALSGGREGRRALPRPIRAHLSPVRRYRDRTRDLSSALTALN